MTDDQILNLLQSGGAKQDKAISHLFHHRGLRSAVQRMVRSDSRLQPTDWEDIFQEGLIQLVKNVVLGKFRGESSIESYLAGICRYKCQEWGRKTARIQPVDPLDWPQESDESGGTALDDLLNEELKGILQSVLEQLSAQCRKVLRWWSADASMQEIAGQLELKSERVAINTKARCKKQLIEYLNRHPRLQQLLKSYRWI